MVVAVEHICRKLIDRALGVYADCTAVKHIVTNFKLFYAVLDAVSLGRALIAEPDFLLRGEEPSICVSCSRCFVLPHMHPGMRCVWQWKKERARMRAAKA